MSTSPLPNTPAPFDQNIARLIDHTILKPDATRAEVLRVCEEARTYRFASVCVNSCWIPLVTEQLHGTDVLVCTVVGFPLGAAATEAKVSETIWATQKGATEVDMVLNVGALRGGELDLVELDIRAVAEATHRNGAILKVILETCLLTDEEKVTACRLSVLAGADFVKTSTGFGKAGATTTDIALMRQTVDLVSNGRTIGVKASGGVRTLEDLRAMVAAGATRIGASASVKIVEATGA